MKKTTDEIQKDVNYLKQQKEKYIDSLDFDSKVKDAESQRSLTEAIVLLEELDKKSNASKSMLKKMFNKIPYFQKITEEAKRTIIEERNLKDVIKNLSKSMDDEADALRQQEHDLNKTLQDILSEGDLLSSLKNDSNEKITELMNNEKDNLDELFLLKKAVRDINALLFFNQNAADSKNKTIKILKALIKTYEINGQTLIGVLVQNLKNATDGQRSERFIEKFTIIKELTRNSMINNKAVQHDNILKSAKLLSSDAIDASAIKEMRKLDEQLKKDFEKLKQQALIDSQNIALEMNKTLESDNDIQLIDLVNSESNSQ